MTNHLLDKSEYGNCSFHFTIIWISRK